MLAQHDGCLAFLALLDHYAGAARRGIWDHLLGMGNGQGATYVVRVAALLFVIVASRVLFWKDS